MTAIEREIKLPAATTFRMPSLDGLAEGVAPGPSEAERLWTTYFDTDDLRLARWGMSLRHRPGQGWTVKLPDAETGPVLARPEITISGNGEAPPPAAVDLVRSVVRSETLRIQARLDTLRRRTALRDATGALVADVFDDEVSVLEGQRPASTFRELEVEIGETAPPGLVEALVDRLREAGAAAPDPTPKYIRSLGPRTPLEAEVAVEELTRTSTCGDVVRRALATSVVRLIEHDPVVWLDVDTEGVHQARVATRRLRSDLRTFRSLVDPAWASSLRSELGWLAGVLGDVRDGDVLLERMRRAVEELPASSRPDSEPVLEALQTRRDEARGVLLEALRSERYVELLDRLVAAANAPVLVRGAQRRARTVLPGLVRRPWRSLEKRVKALGKHPSDDALHDIRIRTKRVRYAAEAVAPISGQRARARKLARAAARLQEELGDLNDAVVAEAWLREWVRAREGSSPGTVRVAEELAAGQHAEAARSRRRWKEAWQELSAPKLRTWM